VTLSVRFVERCDAVPAVLWEAGFGPPLEGVWWYRALEQSDLEEQFTFYYAVVERDGRPVALAPMFLADVPMALVAPPEVMPALQLVGRFFPGVLVQRTLFIGSPCADEGSIAIMAGEDRRETLLALARAHAAQARRLKAHMLVWKDFPDVYAAEMAELSRHAGLFGSVSYPGAMVTFKSAQKTDYLASLKSSHRSNMRRRLKRSTAEVDLTVEVIQNPDDETLEEIIGLFMQTYDKARTRFERLGPAFFVAIARAPTSRFILMREANSGDAVAFMLCIHVGDAVINKFIGLDYARPRSWMLYFRLWDAAVDWTLGLGARTLQSGQTGYGAKLEIGHRLIPLTNYARHRNPIVHAIYAAVAKSISWRTLDEDLANRLQDD
jgi:hypothetical protein